MQFKRGDSHVFHQPCQSWAFALLLNLSPSSSVDSASSFPGHTLTTLPRVSLSQLDIPETSSVDLLDSQPLFLAARVTWRSSCVAFVEPTINVQLLYSRALLVNFRSWDEQSSRLCACSTRERTVICAGMSSTATGKSDTPQADAATCVLALNAGRIGLLISTAIQDTCTVSAARQRSHFTQFKAYCPLPILRCKKVTMLLIDLKLTMFQVGSTFELENCSADVKHDDLPHGRLHIRPHTRRQ